MPDAVRLARLEQQLIGHKAEVVNARNEAERSLAQDRVRGVERDIEHLKSGKFKLG